MHASMGLQEEIDLKLNEIKTDSYPMSIGEIVSLYKEGELEIHPEFQRFFRWSPIQKTKLIESILLGIPIPSIFVSQSKEGIWEVVDGLQRLSTIFEFMGILKDENGNKLPASKLKKTKYLPSLEGKYWDNPSETENSFTSAMRMFLKREKIDIKIVKRESDSGVKYELFQRLNTLGSKLSDQEVRNCIMVMIDKSFFQWLSNLAKYEPFLNCLSLADRLLNEKYNEELALRFFIFKNIDINDIKGVQDLGEFITKKMIKFANQENFNKELEENVFKKTFKLLNETIEENSFKQFNKSKGRFEGKFLISAFESIAIGLGNNINLWENTQNKKDILEGKIKSLWENDNFNRRSGSGINVTLRVPTIVPLGKEIFKP